MVPNSNSSLSPNSINQASQRDPSRWQRATPIQRMIFYIGGFGILIFLTLYAYASYIAKQNYDRVTAEAQKAEQETEALKEKRFYRDNLADWQTNRIVESLNLTITPSVTTVSSDWQIYVNEKYRYSIQYPLSWQIDTINANKEMPHINKVFGPGYFYLGGAHIILRPLENLKDDRYLLDLQIAQPDPVITLDQFLSAYRSNSAFRYDENWITVNGNRALRVEIAGQTAVDGFKFYQVIIPYDGRLYIFTSFNPSTDSIFTTFKFTE